MLTKPTEPLSLLALSFDMDGGRRLLGQQGKSCTQASMGSSPALFFPRSALRQTEMWSLLGAYAVSCEEVKLKVEFSSQVSWSPLASSPKQPVLNSALGNRSVFLCLYVVGCLYLCVCVCLCVCAHKCGWTHEHGCAHECRCSCECRYAHECGHIQRHLYVYVHTSVGVHVSMNTHRGIYIYVYISLHVYVHMSVGTHGGICVYVYVFICMCT